MNNSEAELIKNINLIPNLDAIVVEGFDGVGKGRLLGLLSSYYEVTPYRPDYNFWQGEFGLKREDRWKLSGYFWDIYSSFKHDDHDNVMLFDRGVISGAVYNNDMNIARNYGNMLRGSKVLHILVTCDKEDYAMFMRSRNSGVKAKEIDSEYMKYLEYTLKYTEALAESKVDFIIYKNKYNPSDDRSSKCNGCGHYNYGWCRHPINNCQVDGNLPRCSYSTAKEVQDIDPEMQCV